MDTEPVKCSSCPDPQAGPFTGACWPPPYPSLALQPPPPLPPPRPSPAHLPSPQVGNLGLLFMLLFFIYAALGVELFGKLSE